MCIRDRLEEILEQIPLCAEAKEGLLHHTGRCGMLYDLALSYERANWARIDELAEGPVSYTHLDVYKRQEYTRGGSFALDQEGYLSLPAHGRVLGPDGQPLQLTTDDIRADEFGRIYTEDGDAYLGQIGVFAFADNGQLTKNESGLFGAGGQAAEPVQPSIQWRWVESSNVDMIREMSTMMTAERALQSAAQVLKLYDGLLTKAANELARM